MSPKPGQHLKSIRKPSLEAKADDPVELAEEEGTEQDAPEMYRTFTDQAIALIGSPTSDGRMLASDIDLSFRSFPLPLMWCKQSTSGHDMSYTVGVIEDARIEGSNVIASGYFLNSPEADEATTQIAHGVSNPSVDLANADYIFTDKDGNELDEDEVWDILWGGDGEYFVTFTKAELIGTTLVSTPAFDTKIKLDAERSSREVAIVASIVADLENLVVTYDPTLFSNPNLLAPTRPTIDKETGRIYGHLAEWGVIYRGAAGSITAPRNHNDYANFHTSQVMLDNGKQLSVGRLTVQGGHAPTDHGVSAATARAHYDNACLAFGLVRVGEDRHGIWFSGIPAPGVDPEVFQQGMTAPLSGDWRDCGVGLDMIAAHAVNSPGFPILSGATGPDGRDVALVASFGGGRPAKKRRSMNTGEAFTQAVADGVVRGLAAAKESEKAAAAEQERLAARDAALARARKLNIASILARA